MTPIPHLLREGWHRLDYLISRYTVDRCSENAAALTYMSLFALVPLLTVLYTMASAIPSKQVQAAYPPSLGEPSEPP